MSPSLRTPLVAVLAVALLSSTAVPSFAWETARRTTIDPHGGCPPRSRRRRRSPRRGGNVALRFRWDGPASTRALGTERHARPTFEAGWKRTGHTENNCTAARINGRSGFPPEMAMSVDPTEDLDDAIVWMADLDLLGADARKAPKDYWVWFRCGTGGQFRGWMTKPYLEFQLGHYDSWKSPYNTYSEATLHSIPAEEGYRGFPEQNSCTRFGGDCTDPRLTRSLVYQPWAFNANFESGLSGWYGTRAELWPKCDATPADQGRCYTFWRPSPQGGRTGWLHQGMNIATHYLRENDSWQRGWLGSNTGIQFGLLHAGRRCLAQGHRGVRSTAHRSGALALDRQPGLPHGCRLPLGAVRTLTLCCGQPQAVGCGTKLSAPSTRGAHDVASAVPP